MPDQKNSIGSALLGGLPIVGGVASALLERRWAIKDRDYQNEYNSPANQLRLLKEAGIPAAAYFTGKSAGAQSEQPRNVEIKDKTENLFDKIYMNRLQRENIRGLKLDNDLKQQDLDYFNRIEDRDDEGLPTARGQFSNRHLSLEADLQNKENQRRIAAVTADLKERYGEDITKEELDNVVINNKRLRQLFEDDQQFMDWKRKLDRRLKTKGEEGTIWDVLEEMLGAIMFSSMRLKR